jgi:hypothetical protein
MNLTQAFKNRTFELVVKITREKLQGERTPRAKVLKLGTRAERFVVAKRSL